MPQVSEAVKAEFSVPVELNEPNEAVSKGACIYAAWKLLHTEITDTADVETDSGDKVIDIVEEEDGSTVIQIGSADGSTREVKFSLASGIKNRVIRTVATKSFGIKAYVNREMKIVNLIKKDTILPFSTTQTFGTFEANMENVSIELFQSESYEDHYNEEEGIKVGDSILEGLPVGLPADSPVDITFTLAENGLIEITGSHNGLPLNGKLEKTYSEGIGTQEM